QLLVLPDGRGARDRRQQLGCFLDFFRDDARQGASGRPGVGGTGPEVDQRLETDLGPERKVPCRAGERRLEVADAAQMALHSVWIVTSRREIPSGDAV